MNPEYESALRKHNVNHHSTVENPTFASNDNQPLMKEPTPNPSSRKRSLIRRQKRRGGESHMTLFKAAALASMSSPGGGCEDSSDAEDAAMVTQRFTERLLPIAPSVPELGDHSDSEESSRKRMRRPSPNYYASAIEQTSSILGELCVAGPCESSGEMSLKDEEMTSCETSGHLKKWSIYLHVRFGGVVVGIGHPPLGSVQQGGRSIPKKSMGVREFWLFYEMRVNARTSVQVG